MGIFSWLFNNKEKEEDISNLNNEHKEYLNSDLPICNSCNDQILLDQKSKKWGGKRYHNKCFKKLKKQAMRNFT